MSDDRLLLEVLGDIADAIRHLTVAVSEGCTGIACEVAESRKGPAHPTCSTTGCETPRVVGLLFCKPCAEDIEDRGRCGADGCENPRDTMSPFCSRCLQGPALPVGPVDQRKES